MDAAPHRPGSEQRRRESGPATPRRRPPAWEADTARDGAVVRVRAVPLHLRSLVLILAGATVLAAAGATALVIGLDRLSIPLGPRSAIIVAGLVVVAPVFFGLRAAVRRRAADHRIGFGRSELRIDGPDDTERIPYRAIDELTWRERSEYARLEVRASGRHLTLLVGQARPAPTLTAELPALSRRTLLALEAAGLTAHPSRRGAVLAFRREGARSDAPGTDRP